MTRFEVRGTFEVGVSEGVVEGRHGGVRDKRGRRREREEGTIDLTVIENSTG